MRFIYPACILRFVFSCRLPLDIIENSHQAALSMPFREIIGRNTMKDHDLCFQHRHERDQCPSPSLLCRRGEVLLRELGICYLDAPDL